MEEEPDFGSQEYLGLLCIRWVLEVYAYSGNAILGHRGLGLECS